MTSNSVTDTAKVDSTHDSNEVLKPIGNIWQQQTPVNKNPAGTAIEKGASNEEVDASPKLEYDINTSLPLAAPENTTLVSIEKNNILDEGGDEEEDEEEFEIEEDDSEYDSDDDFPEFEGGEPRGRVVNPIAGPRSGKPPVRNGK